MFAWSADGKYMAWCNSQNLLVLDVYADFAVQLQVDKSRVISIEFSPNNTYISTFEPFSNGTYRKFLYLSALSVFSSILLSIFSSELIFEKFIDTSFQSAILAFRALTES